MKQYVMGSLPVGTKITVGPFTYLVTKHGDDLTDCDLCFCSTKISETKSPKDFKFSENDAQVEFPEGQEYTHVGDVSFNDGRELVGRQLRKRDSGIHYLVVAASENFVCTALETINVEDLNKNYMLISEDK